MGKTMNQSICPGEEQLKAYLLGKVPEDVAEQTERHLQLCPACEATAEILETHADGLIEQLRQPACGRSLPGRTAMPSGGR